MDNMDKLKQRIKFDLASCEEDIKKSLEAEDWTKTVWKKGYKSGLASVLLDIESLEE